MPSDIPSDEMTADFNAIRTRNAVGFLTENGDNFIGIEEERGEADQTLDPGYIREYQYGIYCLISDFATLPDIGDQLEVTSRGGFKIVRRQFMPDGITVLLGLDTAEK